MKIIKASDKCVQIITKYECSNQPEKFLKAYKCPAGVWTIGIGTTIYPNGIKVKQGDIITLPQAYEYLRHDMSHIELQVDSYTSDLVNQNQFDALVSFAYNLGTNALKNSTLLKKVNINVNDPAIRIEFLKWVHSNGNILQSLVNRRKEEADLYFSK